MMNQSYTEAGMSYLLLFHGIELKLIATDEFDDDLVGQIEKLSLRGFRLLVSMVIVSLRKIASLLFTG